MQYLKLTQKDKNVTARNRPQGRVTGKNLTSCNSHVIAAGGAGVVGPTESSFLGFTKAQGKWEEQAVNASVHRDIQVLWQTRGPKKIFKFRKHSNIIYIYTYIYMIITTESMPDVFSTTMEVFYKKKKKSLMRNVACRFVTAVSMCLYSFYWRTNDSKTTLWRTVANWPALSVVGICQFDIVSRKKLLMRLKIIPLN